MTETFYGNLLGPKIESSFQLRKELIEEYKHKEVPFGFNGLGEVVYLRTYAREKDDGCEVWVDTVERVVNGVFEILQHYIVNKLHCVWDVNKSNILAEDMFKRIYNMKFLPPGRGLWAMGSPIITKKGFAAALNNCAFVSTNDIKNDPIAPFTFLMDASMLGVGVGFDTTGAGSFIIKGPKSNICKHIISDDREGWVESVRLLLDAYFYNNDDIEFDYSQIRELGKKLKTFGGSSSGPGPLITLHKNIRKLLNSEIGKPISVTCITDIMNMIGVCTVSGNIRRCLPKDSLVHTKEGLCKIQDIKIGDYVQTSEGFEKVTSTFDQGLQSLLTIYTTDGTFTCTADHYMAVSIGDGYSWIKAKYLTINSKLITSRYPIDGNEQIINDIEFNNYLAWFIGLFTTCGRYCNDHNKLIIRIKTNKNNFDQLKFTLQGYDIQVSEENNEIICLDEQLTIFMMKYIQFQDFNELPTIIQNNTLKIKMAYIAGLIDGSNVKYQILESINYSLIRGIQVLCYSCGFETTLTYNSNETNYILHATTIYSRYIINTIPELVNSDNIDIIISSKKKYREVSIVKITSSDVQHTYDIAVENKHEFFCNGYLTHNSAEIAFGQADCKEFLNLKSYDINPQRIEHGWASNNSIFANIGMDYNEVCNHIKTNGEPGLAWLSNMKSYSRMNGIPDNTDHRVSGGNPCLEQSLESMELCCLVETFPNKHIDLEDFKQTLKSAFLFAKTVTLLPLHWPKSNEIMMRNRRIGCSVSGIAQFITDKSLNTLKIWLETGYQTLKEVDSEISEWLCIRQSIKITSVKPSGTVSILAGATPGIHYPESKYYIRRVRIARDSYLLERIIKAGYHVEPCVMNPEMTIVVEFPVCVGDSIRTNKDVTMWEQLSLAAFMQKYWADNQVSATITFDPETEGPHLANALNYFQYQLKGISFLPRLSDDSIYKQVPYEAITREYYEQICKKINKGVSLSTGIESIATDETHYTYCDNDKCIRI